MTYRTKQQSIAVTLYDDLVIRSLLDHNQFSDPDGIAHQAGISEALWPIFGLLWPSGSYLANRVASRVFRDGETMLEIGCGLALSSLVAHRRGLDVTATDIHPMAEAFLLENIRLNQLAPMKYFRSAWSELPAPAITLGRFDFLVGSDLLYERDEECVLANYIDRHASDQAEIILIDPNRGNRSVFNKCMRGLGFALTETKVIHQTYRGSFLAFERR
jgi:predicted nicotinamide N-methyase